LNVIENELIRINPDGSILLNSTCFKYSTELKMIDVKKWEDLFKIKLRIPESEIHQAHCNLALAIQLTTEKVMLLLAQKAKQLTQSDFLCLAGGVALNCVSNGRIEKSKLFEDIFIQPASGDAGGALGAALVIKYMYFNDERIIKRNTSIFENAYLGPQYNNEDIKIFNRKSKAIFHFEANEDLLVQIVTKELLNKNVIGWFQGRMEYGPRALGNRSILADPREIDMLAKLNLKIKKREGFRPFAPISLEEDAFEYYEMDKPSPYMMLTSDLKPEFRNVIEDADLSLNQKINFQRSPIASVTHIDFSSRIQTVNETQNKKIWKLLNEFKKETGTGILINTSFNERGEPIVCSPDDAYNCFMNTGMDLLVMGNYIYFKNEQPLHQERKVSFKLD
jgi:carbamoyltransferase